MQIVAKLFFIICITFTSATFGMENKKIPIQELLASFYSISPSSIQKTEKKQLFEQSTVRALVFANKNVGVISNFFPKQNEKCTEYGTKVKKALNKMCLYKLYTETGELGEGNLDTRELEEVIKEQLSYELSTEIIKEDPKIYKIKEKLYEEHFGGKILNIETRCLLPNDQNLTHMHIVSQKSELPSYHDNVKNALLSQTYDIVTFENNEGKKTRSGIFLDNLKETLLSTTQQDKNKPQQLAPKQHSNQNQPTIVQRPPLWKDERVYTSLAIGVAGTLGLLKLYNWFRPIQP